MLDTLYMDLVYCNVFFCAYIQVFSFRLRILGFFEEVEMRLAKTNDFPKNLRLTGTVLQIKSDIGCFWERGESRAGINVTTCQLENFNFHGLYLSRSPH